MTQGGRMLALDYLRGFFIVVIIIDHLWRWPSLLAVFSGEGRLWVSAAEGFVIISGLLVGYIRGYKNREQPLASVSFKLLRRALLLYVWFVGMTLLYTALLWHVTTVGPMPWAEIAKDQWNELLMPTFTFEYAHVWIHFLYIYAIFLALTPIAIWLLRTNKAQLLALLVVVGFAYGKITETEWMQWLPVFFIPAIVGYYLPTIQKKWGAIGEPKRTRLRSILYSVAGGTLLISIITTYIIPDLSVSIILNDAFSKDFTIDAWRIILSFVWFVALALLFNKYITFLQKWTSWLLVPLGTRSLSAYIVHGIVILALGILFVTSTDIIYNTLIGIIAIVTVIGLLKNPLVQKIIPR